MAPQGLNVPGVPSMGRRRGLSVPGAVAAATPSGALAIWNMANFTTSGGASYIPNDVAVTNPTPNLLTAPNGLFQQPLYWSGAGGGFTSVTDNYAVGPDGVTGSASRLLGTGDTELWIASNITLGAGTYTVAIDVKSNTGSTQQGRVRCYNGSFVNGTLTNITTSWTTLVAQVVLTAGSWTVMPVISDGTNGLDIQIANARMFAGSTDFGAEVPAGHMHVGRHTTNNPCTYSAGVMDASSAGINIVQFPLTTSIQDFTFCGMIKKVSNASGYHSMLTFVSSTSSALYTTFGMLVDVSAGPTVGFNGGLSNYGSNGHDGLWDLLGDAGWHMISHRYDSATSSLSLWLDDVMLSRVAVTASAATLANFLLGTVNGTSFTSGLKYAGKTGFWPRALTNAEVRAFYKLSQAAALASSITVTPAARVAMFAGDSNTYGTGGTGWPYLLGPSLTNKVLGVNNGFSGYTLANVNTQMSFLTDALPPSSDRTGRKFIFGCMIGTNDLGTYSSEAQYEIDLSAMYDARHTEGWKVMACTLPDNSSNGTFGTRADTLRTSQLSWVGTHLNAVADFRANVHLGPIGASSDTTYFSGDTLHLNTTGQTLAASIAVTPMDSL